MKRMILVDGNSLMYRAYYAMTHTNRMTNSKGVPTAATYAFIRMLNTLTCTDYDAILVAFDAGKKTFRHEFMDDYKGGRAPMPDDLRSQIAYIKQYLELKRIKSFEMPLYEADDIIGTCAKLGESNGYHVDIYSGDKDLLQLVTKDTTVHLTKKGMSDLEDFTPEHFEEVYEIEVSSFIDYKALRGDASDNIKGVPGIGDKKAIKYLKEYKTVENIIANIDNLKGSDKEKFFENKDVALLSKKMVTILCDAPIGLTISDLERKTEDIELLTKFYQELEFTSFLKEMPKKEVSIVEYKYVSTENDLKEILMPNSALIIETDGYNYLKNPIIAAGIANLKGTYIIDLSLLESAIFKDFIENTPKIVFDYKRIYVSLRKAYNIITKNISFDLLLATYILNSNVMTDEFKRVADYYGSNNILSDDDIYGKGAKRKLPETPVLNQYVANKVSFLFNIYEEALKMLEEKNQLKLLLDIEIPLSYVLGKIEFKGVKVDLEELENQDIELNKKIADLTERIHFLAGEEFNISSPKQLATILFERLGIKYPGNSKKGYSTNIDILEAIKNEHPIIRDIIDYRGVTKLQSTYIRGLREQIFPDGKVHSIFQQALTQTGRLSSIEPNLQNIPIRKEEGHLIRRMFIPENKNDSFYSADYSQIELRVLASMANVKHFKEAFLERVDVHKATAQMVFGHSDITSEERRQAKIVNFGIIYGMSPYGLANDLGMTQKEAKLFIEKYNSINPEITEYMEKTIEFCKQNGYVKTLQNRMRYIPTINASNYMEREFAKRMAMNAPIQGSAADIIKIAMIKVDSELERRNLKSQMILQVHDELIIEVSQGEEEIVREIVRENMNNALTLDVPLEVEDSFGKNWYEVK